ncbi:MAG: ROK family protein [Myxococcales bacterium]|nr:ROK family protein [Myxococcales bacterium]
MSGVRLGIDIGGTRIKLGLVADGEVTARAVVNNSACSPTELVGLIVESAAALRGINDQRPERAGVGIPAVLGVGGSPVLHSPNLPWLDNTDLQSRLQVALRMPVRCDNDANCIGWGEATAGAGAGLANQACFTLGTGVGGALVLDGQLERGSRGRGTELGHICVAPGGHPCGCGGRGCLEQYASQTGLLRLMGEVGLPSDEPSAVVTLFQLAAHGDRRAVHIVATASAALGRAIATLHGITSIGSYIFGGGISAALPQLTPGIRQTLRAHGQPDDLQLLAGHLGTDAGVIGAALLV